jgi:branched-chain amino acid transport system substrate-binding protein
MKMFRKILWSLIVAMLFVAGTALNAEEIKVGVIMPLSGSLVAYGKATLEGIQLKVDEINASGGVDGKKIKLLIQDNRGAVTDSRDAYKKLAGSDKVVAVIGPITSTNTLAIRRDTKKLKVPVISPTATNDKVTLRNPYIFRACFNDSFQGKIVANYAFKNLNNKTAAVLIDMNSDYSKGLSKSFEAAFTKAGGKIIASEGYQQKDTGFSSQLKKIKDSGAETLFVPGYPPELPLIIKQAKVIGYKSRLCGADGWDNQAVINGSGNNVEGCFMVGAFSREDKRPVVQSFIKAFEDKYKKESGTFQALGYDSVSILEKGLEDGLTPGKVRQGIAKIKGLKAVTGTITMTKDGDPEKSAIILEIVKVGDKHGVKYKATIEP